MEHDPTTGRHEPQHPTNDVPDVDVADVVVLGMGPGGEEVAGRLADAGLEVIGIEAGLVGGECPYWACIPSKMMVRAADLLAEVDRANDLAGNASVTPDWDRVASRIRQATDDWDDTAAVERFTGRGGVLVRGHGHLTAPDTVVVGDRTIRARRAVVVATGSSASIPPIDGLADSPFWTNHQAIRTTELPTSMIVLGGGAVGAELAQVVRRFGVATTIVERADRLLPSEEPVAGDVLAEVFADDGIDVVTSASVERVSFDDDEFSVRTSDGRDVRAERLLVATGRRVDLAAIGADTIGVDTAGSAIPVDEHLRVTDGVWAVGDVTGVGPFTHVAVHQARLAADDILGRPHPRADEMVVPRVTFTDPEVGAVGLTSAEATTQGIDVAIGRTEVAETTRGWLHGAGNAGVIQVVVDRDRNVVVGATSIGPAGGEVLGLLTLAVHAAVPVDDLRSMVYAYPTFHRGVADALADLT